MKVVRLSALRTAAFTPQEIFLVLLNNGEYNVKFLVLISVRGWVNPQGHSAAGMIKSMKNSDDSIGNRTRHLTACSAVCQPTAPPRAPVNNLYIGTRINVSEVPARLRGRFVSRSELQWAVSYKWRWMLGPSEPGARTKIWHSSLVIWPCLGSMTSFGGNL